MYNFKDFNIQPETKPFAGEKIKIDRILNKEIQVQDYKIEPSNFKEKGNGKRLTLQIQYDNSQRILFTGSTVLQDVIEKIPKDKFPFVTTIIKEDDWYKFT